MERKPPKLAVRFLTFFLKEELQEEVLGDLEEAFYSDQEKKIFIKSEIPVLVSST